MKQIGIVGLGHLGEIHLQQWINIVDKSQLHILDTDIDRMNHMADKYQVSTIEDYDTMLQTCEFIDIVTPTTSHFELAQKALIHNKHVFIEKPACESIEEIQILIDLQKKSKTNVQIGYVERFNPGYTSIENELTDPNFFEIHRLAPFNPRGTEVSVIMDLMIHDLDIVMHLVHSPVKSISATGVGIINRTPDIANARIEFENGCVANLTASRISMKKMRKMRIFKEGMYATIDFLKKESEIYHILPLNKHTANIEGLEFQTHNGESKKLINVNSTSFANNAILDELNLFYFTSKENKISPISLISALKSTSVALSIQSRIIDNVSKK